MPGKWSKIATIMVSRTDNQCWRRHSILNGTRRSSKRKTRNDDSQTTSLVKKPKQPKVNEESKIEEIQIDGENFRQISFQNVI